MGAGDLELIDMEDQSLELLRAWRSRDLKKFKEILNSGCNVNAEYKDEFYQPILGALSRDSKQEEKEFAVAVLAKNAEKDKLFASGKCAIHYAAERANLAFIHALIDAKADVNVRDQAGNTALHILAQKKWDSVYFKQCMELLLSHPDINVNILNIQGISPIRHAIRNKNREAVVCMIEKEMERKMIDFDGLVFQKLTTREAICAQYPDLEERLPKDFGPSWSYIKMDASNLFFLLTEGEIDRFCTAFSKEMEDKTQIGILKERNGEKTLLQYATYENMPEVVELILEKGGDPTFANDKGESPIHIAAREGYPEILKMLLDKSTKMPPFWGKCETPLHNVVHYGRSSKNHAECLKMLLEKEWTVDGKIQKIDVNGRDSLGNTPLDYAVLYNDDETTATLLDNGAYIGVENNGVSPLSRMNPKILENFLNKQMNLIPLYENPDEKLEIDFSFLRPLQSEQECQPEEEKLIDSKNFSSIIQPETKPLLTIVHTPDLRRLTKHPVFTSFTYLKWQRIQWFFYANLIFYLTFCMLLTGYILFANGNEPPKEKILENVINPQNEKIGYHDKTNSTKILENNTRELSNSLIRIIILIFVIILAFREFFQFISRPLKFLTSVENYLELSLICLTLFIVGHNCSRAFYHDSKLQYVCPQVCAFAILFSWIEMVLLIGKHPYFSVQIEMFTKVSTSFTKFLSWYILLIIAFALSFFVLFRGCTGDCAKDNPFSNEGSALFKTVVMLTGEFEAGDIPFISYVGTSHIIFTMFVFLIAIVLLNLLNGLAVADTQVIIDDAYLYSCCARVEFIYFVEELFSTGLIGRLTKQSNCFKRTFSIFSYFARRITLFNGFLPSDAKIIIFTQEGNRIDLVEGHHAHYSMDHLTVSTAKKIFSAIEEEEKLENKEEKADINGLNQEIAKLSARLSEFDKRFEAIEHSNKQIEKLLIQNIAIISLNHANNDDC